MLQSIVQHCPAYAYRHLARSHAKVRFHRRSLFFRQVGICPEGQLFPGLPVHIRRQISRRRFNRRLALSNPAENKVAVILVFLTPSPHMPAIAVVGKRAGYDPTPARAAPAREGSVIDVEANNTIERSAS